MAETSKSPAKKPLISTEPAAAAAPSTPVAERPVRPPVKADKAGWWWGTGRRKTAVARVRLKPATGEGKVTIQLEGKRTKTIQEYFNETRDQTDAIAPLKLSGTLGKVDVFIRLSGGGFMGQAGAVKLGVARALIDFDPTTEAVLRDNGMLTRDARDVERKKYGQSGARRRFQFSKR